MKRKLRKILRFMEIADVFVAVFDENDVLIYANKLFRDAFFVEWGEFPVWADLMRRNFHARRGTVVAERDFELWLQGTISRRGKVPFRAFETDTHDGRWLWMTETVDEDGWMVCVASDITGLRAQGRSLRQQRDIALRRSLTDDLTGIANRRFLMDRLDDILAGDRSSPAAGPGCFAILDLDNFKQVNDRFGHFAGDRVLIEFAREISLLVRRTDCFGRLGGEEFGLVLPGATAAEALEIVNRMLGHVRALRPFPEHPDFAYSCSAGVSAVLPGEAQSEVYARSDMALYRAKREGKNRVCLAETAA